MVPRPSPVLIKVAKTRATRAYQQTHYHQVFVWKPDFRRIRELEYFWKRSRVAVIHALLNMFHHDPSTTRPVTCEMATWDRLDDLARSLDCDAAAVASRVLTLSAHCSPADLATLLKTPPTP